EERRAASAKRRAQSAERTGEAKSSGRLAANGHQVSGIKLVVGEGRKTQRESRLTLPFSYR
ncbi:MAG TPA: hypothetical protein PLU25_13755, partial [Acidobacteriota bacterium]|nr:hypothetical protein [Acidobacteriota bacterium]